LGYNRQEIRFILTAYAYGNISLSYLFMGTAVAQWLRCCATSRKVVVSVTAGVSGIFHWYKIPSKAVWPWDRLSL